MPGVPSYQHPVRNNTSFRIAQALTKPISVGLTHGTRPPREYANVDKWRLRIRYTNIAIMVPIELLWNVSSPYRCCCLQERDECYGIAKTERMDRKPQVGSIDKVHHE